MAVIAHRGSLHFNLKRARMPPHLKHGARSSECEKAQHSKKAGLPFLVHAHMLRHSTGYKLAADDRPTRSIQDYLGHRDIRHTAGYAEVSPKPFRDFFRD